MKKRQAFLVCLFLSLFLGEMLIQTVSAEDPIPKWRQNLDCAAEDQKYTGIEYCRGKELYSNVHVVVIDLQNPAVRLEYLIVSGIDNKGNPGICQDVNRASKQLGGPGCDDPVERQYYPVMSLDEAVTQAKSRYQDLTTALVINGDYSACTTSLSGCGKNKQGYPNYREHGPEGLTIVAGKRLDGIRTQDGDNNAVERPWFVVSKDAPLEAVISKLDSDSGGLPYSWVYTGMGGAPRLIKDGDVVEWEISSCYHAAGSCYDGASQTAVGLTQDGRWLFLVLAVKHKTLLDLANFMHDQLETYQAIKFDGGGSSKLWFDEKTIEAGDARKLTNYLVVLSQPGRGITTAEQPTCPPADCTFGKDVAHEFFVQVVQNLKDVEASDFAANALEAWKPYENTEACWNPLATTWQMNMVCYFNCIKENAQGNCIQGVQNYPDQATGVKATANTLNQSYYDAIRKMLRFEAFNREELRTALGKWGTCKGASCNPLLDDWQELWDANQGIVTPPETPPGEPPSDGLSWWDQMLKWWQSSGIYKTWQDISQKVAELQQAIKDIQQFIRDVQAFFQQIDEYEKSIQQCWGGAALALVAIGVVWRKAKR